MAIGGFNGTDPLADAGPVPALRRRRRIHYFVRGKMVIGHWGSLTAASGSHESADIAEWVQGHYAPLTVERVLIYDLTQPPQNS